MYSRISDLSSPLEEMTSASGVLYDGNANETASMKDKEVKTESSNSLGNLSSHLKDIQAESSSRVMSEITSITTYSKNNNIKWELLSNNKSNEGIDNFFPSETLDIDNYNQQLTNNFITGASFMPPKNNSSTELPQVFQKKVSNLRDNNETILVSPFDISLPINKTTINIGLIRINNNYKLLNCKTPEEFNLIKKLHNIVYQGKHFNLEYELVKDANIGYLAEELDQYGFLKNDDIQEELSLIGENLKKLCDVKAFLGYKAPQPRIPVYNVVPSFQSQLSSNQSNEITGFDTYSRFGEDYATIDPSFDMNRTMDIWYNKMFMTGLITEWEIFLKDCNMTNEQIKALGYFKEISKYKNIDVNGAIIQELQELFNTELFDKEKDFQEKVDCILTRSYKHCPNLARIKQYIQEHYTLDSNVENRIQFTTLLNEVMRGLNVGTEFTEMMKKSLPLVLAELHLNKKRYSSGFFWYGMVKKDTISTTPRMNCGKFGGSKSIKDVDMEELIKKNKNEFEKKYEDLVKEREYENESILENLPNHNKSCFDWHKNYDEKYESDLCVSCKDMFNKKCADLINEIEMRNKVKLARYPKHIAKMLE